MIIGVVVSIDVVILLIGTANPQSRIIANATKDAEHPPAPNVRV